MTDAGAERFDLDQQRIVVAIDGDFLDDEAVPGAFALHPQLIARAAVEGDKAGVAGFAKGFVVHEADHENAVRRGVLNHCRYEAVQFAVIETHAECRRRPEAIKKPAGTAAGVLSFDFTNRLSQDPPHEDHAMMVMMAPGDMAG